jgi:hypothetical protein
MKKLVLTTVCALAVSGAAFAQGFVNWSAISFANVTAQTNSTQFSPLFGGGAAIGGTVGGTATAATSFYYELLYTSYSGSGGALPTIPSLAALLTWNDAGQSANNSASAGRLAVVNSNAGAPVPWAAGVTDSIVLVGWSADLGTTWGAVSNELATGSYKTVLAGQQGFFGLTTTGFIAAGASSVAGATVFASAPVDGTGTPIQSLNTQLYLLPVPEPATMALVGLGGLSLMLFRRQRK